MCYTSSLPCVNLVRILLLSFKVSEVCYHYSRYEGFAAIVLECYGDLLCAGFMSSLMLPMTYRYSSLLDNPSQVLSILTDCSRIWFVRK